MWLDREAGSCRAFPNRPFSLHPNWSSCQTDERLNTKRQAGLIQACKSRMLQPVPFFQSKGTWRNLVLSLTSAWGSFLFVHGLRGKGLSTGKASFRHDWSVGLPQVSRSSMVLSITIIYLDMYRHVNFTSHNGGRFANHSMIKCSRVAEIILIIECTAGKQVTKAKCLEIVVS